MSHFLVRALFLLCVVLHSNNLIAAECEHVISNSYNSGFQAEIQITNTGSTTLTNWEITWSYSDGTTVSNVWNADSSGTNPVTATPPSWANGIAPGATYGIGLNGIGGGVGVTIVGDICGEISALPASLQLAKTWVDGEPGDEITATTTGLIDNPSVSSTTTGSNTDIGSAVQVSVGDNATLPSETFISGVASDYTVSDWVCDDAANSTIAAGGTLPITSADAGNVITCTLTNQWISDSTPTTSNDIACEHIVTNHWGSGFQGSVEITNISSAEIDNWTTTWGYADNTVITYTWGAVTAGTNPVTATPETGFTSLASGATISIGFTATGAGNLDFLTCSTVLSQSTTLTLTKDLINDNGGTATASDWTLEANLAAGTAELSGISGVTSSSLEAGDYELTETGPAGYTQTNLACDSGVLIGTSLTMAPGDDVNCTFSNDDQPVSLTLVKVVNNQVGTAAANEWTLDATLAGLSILNGVTGTPGVASSYLSAGDYVLSESGGADGYRLESLTCDAGILDDSSNTLALTNGDVAVCTFTNRDLIIDLSISKSVDDSTPNIGDIINFTLEVINLGPDPASNVVVNDMLPAGLSFVAGSMTGGATQNQSAPNLGWTINDLGVGVANISTLQYQVTVIGTP